uniref:GST N-terminal domain-containing protein n=1 Tax=Meleagris gallopavo TaxID=9103 RepID=A0A803YRS9_MELGA
MAKLQAARLPSWWPISALENDAGKSKEGEENQDPTDPALRSQDRLVLYHWTQSFSSQKVRLVIAEKGLPCEERDVSMPLLEHKEPWFMRLNLGEEVPVIIHRDNIISDYNQIIDYMERNFTGENVPQLIPEPGTLLHSRVLQYRELLDSLPMDAYTHGCILHPELTTDSMIPKYATAEIRSKSPLGQGAGRTPALHLPPGRLHLQAAPIINTGSPESFQPRTGGSEYLCGNREPQQLLKAPCGKQGVSQFCGSVELTAGCTLVSPTPTLAEPSSRWKEQGWRQMVPGRRRLAQLQAIYPSPKVLLCILYPLLPFTLLPSLH